MEKTAEKMLQVHMYKEAAKNEPFSLASPGNP